MPGDGDASSEGKPSRRLEVAKEFVSHIGHRDFEGAMNLLTPDATYRVSGSSSLSGVFKGRADVAQHLSRFVERTNQTFDVVEWEDWMVGVAHVAALGIVHVQTPGKLHRGRVVFVSQFQLDDKIDEFIVFFEDEAGVARFLDV